MTRFFNLDRALIANALASIDAFDVVEDDEEELLLFDELPLLLLMLLEGGVTKGVESPKVGGDRVTDDEPVVKLDEDGDSGDKGRA